MNSVDALRAFSINAENHISNEKDLQIVIPAYNAMKYIRLCLDSILLQKTNYSYQIVIIDDGSTDGTGAIIDSYELDDRIKIIHQKNQGIACSRNVGIKNICGRYLMFVDSDDILLPGAIQELIQKADSFNADVAEGGSCYVSSGGKKYRYNLYKESVDQNDYAKNLRGQPWGKVIKSTLFKNIKFPESYDFEDSIFAYCLYPRIKRKYTIRSCVYGWRIYDTSISKRIRNSNKSIDTYYVSIALWDYFINHYPVSEIFNIQVLNQIALNYARTRTLGIDVLEAGFVLERESYLKMFKDCQSLKGKYRKLDCHLRDGDFGKYSCLCEAW